MATDTAGGVRVSVFKVAAVTVRVVDAIVLPSADVAVIVVVPTPAAVTVLPVKVATCVLLDVQIQFQGAPVSSTGAGLGVVLDSIAHTLNAWVCVVVRTELAG